MRKPIERAHACLCVPPAFAATHTHILVFSRPPPTTTQAPVQPSSDSLFSNASANSSLSPICFRSLDLDHLHSFPPQVWQGLRLRVNRYRHWLAWVQARRYRVHCIPSPSSSPSRLSFASPFATGWSWSRTQMEVLCRHLPGVGSLNVPPPLFLRIPVRRGPPPTHSGAPRGFGVR